MDYIYIDESGDLGKDSKYFIISAIISSNKTDLERIINKINRIFKKQLLILMKLKEIIHLIILLKNFKKT